MALHETIFTDLMTDIGCQQKECKSHVVEFGETIKNPAYRILQTEYSGCLDISAHA